MKTSVSNTKRDHSAVILNSGYDYDCHVGKRVRHNSSHIRKGLDNFFPPPSPPSYKYNSPTKASMVVFNSCFNSLHDKENEMDELCTDEECNDSSSAVSSVEKKSPSKKYIDEYFTVRSRRRQKSMSCAMDIPLTVCGSCSAPVEEDDMMEENSCYFCSKRGCKSCIEKCIVCKDLFCSSCSVEVYGYGYDDERICIDCNCDNPIGSGYR